MSKAKGITAYLGVDLSKTVGERIKALCDELANDEGYDGYDVLGLRQCGFVSADEATQSTVWTLHVTPQLCNKSGNLHGGAAATILDTLTSTALLTIAKPGFLDAGHVSRALNTTYLRPVPAGTTCTVECEVVAAGRKTAMVRGVIKLPDGKVAVHCVHDKAVFMKNPAKL